MRTLVPHRSGRPSSIFDGFDHIFDSFFTEQPPAARTRAPAVDIREEDKTYVLQAELPGVAEKDLKVSIDDNVLSISANADEKDEQNPGAIWSGNAAGSHSPAASCFRGTPTMSRWAHPSRTGF